MRCQLRQQIKKRSEGLAPLLNRCLQVNDPIQPITLDYAKDGGFCGAAQPFSECSAPRYSESTVAENPDLVSAFQAFLSNQPN